MSISVTNQLFIFASCALCGVIIGLIFDIFRIARRIVRTGDAAALIQDIVYWIIAAAVFFLAMQHVSSGELRLFQFVALFFGMLIYFLTVSPFVIRVSVAIIGFLAKALAFVIKIIMTPVVFVFKIIKKPLFIVLGAGKKGGGRIKRGISQAVYNAMKLRKRI